MANTSRPCSSANCTVINAPLRSPASTTSVPSAKPLIRRLRAGKLPPSGATVGAYSESSAPCSQMRSAIAWFCGGYTLPMPLPKTAIVRPCASRAARCAMESMPSAKPETTVMPALAKSWAILWVTSRPYGVALRVPTTATAQRSVSSNVPRTYNNGGDESIWRNKAGYSSSPNITIRAPIASIARHSAAKSRLAWDLCNASIVRRSKPAARQSSAFASQAITAEPQYSTS